MIYDICSEGRGMELRIDIGYDRKRPLYTDVCLSFVRGDIINVVGDNGSGKSTLYKTLCGSIPPLRGKVPREVTDSCMLVSDTIRPPSELLVTMEIGRASCRERV